MFVQVGENEKKLALDAYLQSGHGGWNAVYLVIVSSNSLLEKYQWQT